MEENKTRRVNNTKREKKIKTPKDPAAETASTAEAAILDLTDQANRRVKQKKSHKKLVLGIGIPLGVLLLAYIGISVFFMNSFLYGTTINGVDCFGSSPEKVSQLLAAKSSEYQLTLKERSGQTETISGPDIGLTWDYSAEVQEFLDAQSAFAWPALLMDHKNFTIEPKVQFEEEKLDEVLDSLSCFDPSNVTGPEDAYIEHTDTGFVFVEEVQGNKLVKSRVKEQVIAAVNANETQLSLEETDCYVKPEITMESEKISKPKAQIEKYLETEITYEFGSDKEVLDKDTIHQWISIDEQNEAVLSEDEVASYVKKLAVNYDTVGKKREFKTSGGYVQEVSGGPYGWKINRAEEREALYELIQKGARETREPIYSQTAALRGANDIGNTYVEVNLTTQHMWFYKNGTLIKDTDIVSGMMTEKRATPPLVGFIHYKQRNAVLRGEDYETPVKMWMPVAGDIGIHDASWRKSFGGQIYVKNGSHGCINTPYSAVKVIFENIETGTPCVFYYGPENVTPPEEAPVQETGEEPES